MVQGQELLVMIGRLQCLEVGSIELARCNPVVGKANNRLTVGSLHHSRHSSRPAPAEDSHHAQAPFALASQIQALRSSVVGPPKYAHIHRSIVHRQYTSDAPWAAQRAYVCRQIGLYLVRTRGDKGVFKVRGRSVLALQVHLQGRGDWGYGWRSCLVSGRARVVGIIRTRGHRRRGHWRGCEAGVRLAVGTNRWVCDLPLPRAATTTLQK